MLSTKIIFLFHFLIFLFKITFYKNEGIKTNIDFLKKKLQNLGLLYNEHKL